MSQQAQVAMQQPTKMDVVPVRPQNPIGEPLPVKVVLLNGAGQEIKATENTTAELQVIEPSGQVSSTTVTLLPGESSKQVDLTATETGVTKLSVRQKEDRLLGSSNYVLVAPKSSLRKNRRGKVAPKRRASDATGPSSSLFWSPSKVHGAKLIYAAYFAHDAAPAAGPPASGPQLMLTISGEDAAGGIRANGKTYARVQVFYVGPDDPVRDIQIWLQWSNGAIEPNPIVIHRNDRVGEAHWTSQFPIPTATLKVAATNPPNLWFVGSNEKTVKFSENIEGIGFDNPPDRITIVDRFNLTGMFFDPGGSPVRLIDQRKVHFGSNSPILTVEPTHSDIPADHFDFSTVLAPTYVGKSVIEASTPGYRPAAHEITVTWLSVLGAIVVGGFLGGVAAYIKSQGKLWMRITAGVIVGLVASWAYVFVGLPKVETTILHNQLSVLFVSLLAAFTGVKVLSVVTGKLNLGF